MRLCERLMILLTLSSVSEWLICGGVDAVVARMNLQYKVPLQCDDEFLSRLWLEKQGVRYVFHQDIFRAKDEKLCLKATVELVCLINGKLGNSEDYDKAFEKYFSPQG